MKATLILSLLLTSLWAFAADKVINKTTSIDFVNIKDGDKVKSPFKVKFTVRGMAIKPAGDMTAGTGHHHLIVDGAFVAEKQPVINDEKHIHFGKGQTETELSLQPGKHTLTLQFADGAHFSYGEKLSKTITVIVEK